MTDQERNGPDYVVHIRGPIHSSATHAPQVVIAEIVEAPRLKGITTPDFVEFKEKREIYERRLAGNGRDPQALSHLLSYRDSIPRHLLSFLVQSSMVEATKLEEITEEDLKNCIARNAIFDEKGAFNTFEQVLANLSMKEQASPGTLTSSVADLCLQYLETLEKWGRDDLIELTPDAAIDHIMDRVIPYVLRARMRRRTKSDIPDGEEKSFRRFLTKLLAESHRIDVNARPTRAP